MEVEQLSRVFYGAPGIVRVNYQEWPLEIKPCTVQKFTDDSSTQWVLSQSECIEIAIVLEPGRYSNQLSKGNCPNHEPLRRRYAAASHSQGARMTAVPGKSSVHQDSPPWQIVLAARHLPIKESSAP